LIRYYSTFVIHKILPCILFVLVCTLIHAQNWQELANSVQAHLAENPDDDDARLKLGYYYMMSGQPLLALREYRRITQRAGDNLDAWAGVIWAYNGMRQYELALATVEEQTALHPNYAPFHNLRANVYLRLGDATAARHYYSRALDDSPFDRSVRRIAFEGLGWSYHYLRYHKRSTDNFRKAQSLTPQGEQVYGIELSDQSHWQTEFAWTRPYADANSYFASQAYNKGSWGLEASFDEFQKDKKHFRTAFQLQSHKQIGSLHSRIYGTLIFGIDGETYPAYGLGISNNHPLYIRTAVMTPIHRFHYTHYPRFDVFQNDIALAFIYRKADVGYQFTHLYQDGDSINSDRQHTQHHLWLRYPILPQTFLGFYSGWGDQSWWITPTGSVGDTFVGLDSYYGMDISFPVAGSIYAGFYHQIGSRNDDWEYLMKAKLILLY